MIATDKDWRPFEPCNATEGVLVPEAKRFFHVDYGGDETFTIVARDVDHAKQILRDHGVEFAKDDGYSYLAEQLAAANAEIERMRERGNGFKQEFVTMDFRHKAAQAEIDRLRRDYDSCARALAAMTKARDEACDIAERFTQAAQIGESAHRENATRIAELRKVGG